MIGNGYVLIIFRVDVIIVLPPYKLVYLSGRRCTARGGRWPSTGCACRKFESQRFREREIRWYRFGLPLDYHMLCKSCRVHVIIEIVIGTLFKKLCQVTKF